jgi:hypothetical protein
VNKAAVKPLVKSGKLGQVSVVKALSKKKVGKKSVKASQGEEQVTISKKQFE